MDAPRTQPLRADQGRREVQDVVVAEVQFDVASILEVKWMEARVLVTI